MAQVDLQDIRKSYDGNEIIRGVNLAIRDREFTVFVGPSGCGKSTLLRLIAGLEEITSGTLRIDGQRVNDVAPSKRGLALVFQSYALYPHMNVAENMSFSLKLAGISKADRDRKVQEAARILHLEALLDRKPKDLSGGQRQRVAIGRAIVRNPKVFLFDEPLSNLDASLRVRMRLELTKLHRELHATTIYVTHDQVEAMTMADRIVVLQNGMIEQVGSPMELYNHPVNQFVAGFLGSPRMNFIKAIAHERGGSGTLLTVGRKPSDLNVPLPPGVASIEGEVTLGARPEHIKLVASGGLPARVQGVEHLGSESYLHLSTLSDELLTLRVDGETPICAEQMVQISFTSRSLHVFNADGLSLRQGASSLPNIADYARAASGAHHAE